MKKRFFSLLLAVALVVGLLPVNALAAEDPPQPRTGPMEIFDQTTWNAFAAAVNGGGAGGAAAAPDTNAKLTGNITWDTGFNQITSQYTGEFDGNGKTITGSSATVFSQVSGTIHDLTVSGGAAICGTLTGTIENCAVIGGGALPSGGTIKSSFVYANNGGSGSSVYGPDGNPISSSAASDFSSGKVCWLLNGKNADGPWRQTLPDSTYPSFSGGKVYNVYADEQSCEEEPSKYSNDNALKIAKKHTSFNENGACANPNCTGKITLSISSTQPTLTEGYTTGGTLEADATANFATDKLPTPTYKWLINNVEESSATARSLEFPTGKSEGTYECACEVTYGTSTIKSDSTTVTVNKAASQDPTAAFKDGNATSKTCKAGEPVIISVTNADDTKTVGVYDGADTDALETAPVENGGAEITINPSNDPLPGGTHTLTVKYTDAVAGTSPIATLTLTIEENTTTALRITPSFATHAVGDKVDIQVTGREGTVVAQKGSTEIARVDLSGAGAALTGTLTFTVDTTKLALGENVLKINYIGATASEPDQEFTLTVTAASTPTITVSNGPYTVGNPITVTVSNLASVTTVELLDNGISKGSKSPTANKAEFTFVLEGEGEHTLTVKCDNTLLEISQKINVGPAPAGEVTGKVAFDEALSLGSPAKCPYGRENIKIKVTEVARGDDPVDTGEVQVYCGETSVSGRSEVRGGAAESTFNTEQAILRPAKGSNSSSRTLDVYYYDSSSSAAGRKIGSLVFDVELTPMNATNATVSAPDSSSGGNVTITAPEGYEICHSIYEKAPADWGASITTRATGQETSYGYFLKDTGTKAISTPKTATIPLYNPGTKDDISKVDLDFHRCVYNGQPQPPIIEATGYGLLTEGVDYAIEYLTDDHTNAGFVEIKLRGRGTFEGSSTESSYEIEPVDVKPYVVAADPNTPIEKVYDKGVSCAKDGLTVEIRNTTGTASGFLGTDGQKITVSADFEYASPNVDDNIDINAVNIKLLPKGSENVAKNYRLPDPAMATIYGVGKITPRTLTLKSAKVDDKVYDGTKTGTVASVTFDRLDGSPAPVLNTDYAATAEFDDENVLTTGDGKIDVTVTVRMLDKNFTLDASKNTVTTQAKITPAAPEIAEWPKAEPIEYGETLAASGWSVAGKALTIFSTSDAEEILLGEFKWVDSTILPDAGKSKQKVKFTPDDTNYAAVEGEVEIEVNAEPIIVEPTVSGTMIRAKDLAYGQKLTEAEIDKDTYTITPNEIKGKWEWIDITKLEKAGNYTFKAKFIPDSFNYAPSDPVDVAVKVNPAKPKIDISPADKSIVKSGTTITTSVKISNPHDSFLKDAPKEATLTYKIGDGDTQTIGKDGKFKIPDDTAEGTPVVITATTAAIPEYYATGSATATLSVTKRDLVNITAPSATTDKKKIYYNGSGHDGHGSLRFYDAETEDEIKNFIKGTDYSISWRDSSGKELKTAPVYPGKYEFMVHVDTNKYAGTSEWVEFVIEKKPLEWKTNSLTAIKAVGNDKEIPVSGTLGIKGTVNKDKVEIPADYMKDLITSGFADKTEAGEYKDVTAVPKNGKTWNEVLPALDYYVWPSTNPGVKAIILPKAEEGEKLYVDIAPDSLSHSLQKLKVQKPNSTDSTMRTAMKGEIGSNFKTTSNNTTTVAQKFFDVTLMVEKEDGSLEEATTANFPSSGKLMVRIKYSDLTAKNNDATSSCAFEVVHMFVEGSKAGEMETIKNADIKKETDGIVFEVSGLSPLLVAWSKKGGGSSSSSGDNNNNNNGSSSKPNRPSWDDDDDEEYRVRVYSSSGGKVTASPRYAEEDETVTLKITPDSGYVLNKVTVENKRGKTIRVRERNGKYTFTMPDEDVEVDVSFSPIFSPITQPIVTTPSTSTGNLWTSTNTTTSVGSNCTYGSSCPSRTYSDLNASMWYHEPVDFAIQRGLMTGLPDGRFAPYSTLSRAMIVQILYTHAGKPAYTTAANFNDVDSGAWYESAVYWAVSSGVAQGVGDGMFSPSAPVTREQLAVMLRNYASNRGISLSSSQAAISFTDRTRISSWATDSVSTMQRAGIISGKEGNMFEPKGTASRVEAAQMLWKLLK